MSYRSGQYSEYSQQHPHIRGKASNRRAAAGGPAPAARETQDGYTLTHAGKQARVVPDYTVPVEVGEKAKPAAPAEQEANATVPPPAPVTATPLAPPTPAPASAVPPAITEAPPPNAETGP